MKFIAFIFLLFSSFSVLACPDLQGAWKCNGDQVYGFNQLILPNGFTDFKMTVADKFSSETVHFITDGKTSFEAGNINALAACDKQKVEATSFNALSLFADNNLKSILQIVIRLNDHEIAVSQGPNFPGAPLTLADFVVCQKK